MIPAGEYLRISSILAVQGRTTENTFCSRTRRAINCEYCAPKSRTTIDCDSTDECLKSEVPCKANRSQKEISTKNTKRLQVFAVVGKKIGRGWKVLSQLPAREMPYLNESKTPSHSARHLRKRAHQHSAPVPFQTECHGKERLCHTSRE